MVHLSGWANSQKLNDEVSQDIIAHKFTIKFISAMPPGHRTPVAVTFTTPIWLYYTVLVRFHARAWPRSLFELAYENGSGIWEARIQVEENQQSRIQVTTAKWEYKSRKLRSRRNTTRRKSKIELRIEKREYMLTKIENQGENWKSKIALLGHRTHVYMWWCNVHLFR